MVAPIEVNVEEGKGGKVEITEGEYTSEGFARDGLNPLERHSAGIACWYTGSKPATHEWPNNTFYGSYVAASYGGEEGMTKEEALASTKKYDAPYDLRYNTNDVVNNTDGSIVGYKYFNFGNVGGSGYSDKGPLYGRKDVRLLLNATPLGVDGTIEIRADRPWDSQGMLLGTIELRADMPQQPTELSAVLPDVGKLEYKRAIFFVFKSDTKEKSLCTLHNFVFE